MKKKRVLLVGWDSADWKIINELISEGGMKGVQSLMRQGVHGNLATLEPQLSPMLWTSIATGKMSYQHGVHGFTEVDPVSGQVVPVSAASRKSKTVWEMLESQGLRSHVVGWFATQGEQDMRGKMVSNMFPHLKGVPAGMDPSDWPEPMPGTYWPEELAGSMNELRVSKHEIDADILQPFIPRGAEIDQEKDKRVFRLVDHLAEAYSVHSAATHLMETDPEWDFMAVYYRAMDEISHHFMPYHPPKMEGVPEKDYELYKNVVKGTYLAHDAMLQRLIQLAGDDATIMLVSDHGFHNDHLRPRFTPQVPAGITVWHRDQGVIVVKGEGIKQENTDLYGARLLDITPTILHHFGLPVGKDMEGRVLSEMFVDASPVKNVPSWESAGQSRKRGSLTQEESHALLEQFVELGYIDELSSDTSEAAASTERENKWNQARSYLYTGKYAEALPLLEDCHEEVPERIDFAQLLSRTQLNLGLLEEAEETLAPCLSQFGGTLTAQLLQALIALEKGDAKAALAVIEGVKKENLNHPKVLEACCRSYVLLGEWEAARRAAQTLRSIDRTSVQALLTLARYEMSRKEYEKATDIALEAIQLEFSSPRAHLVLGRALAAQNLLTEAVQALRNCLRLQVDNRLATEALADVYERLGSHEQASQCLGNLARIKAEKAVSKDAQLQSLRSGMLARAKVRHSRRKEKQEQASARSSGQQGGKEFIIVSGLPRSGTSLMMQMLQSAGMELKHDGKRAPDDDNPEGYWEWEEIKGLKKNPRLIEQAEAQVVKVISALLPSLPLEHRYRVIFMKRPVEQVVNSQWKMIQRAGRAPRTEKEHLISTQEKHVELTLQRLEQSENISFLEVDFPTLITDSTPQLSMINEFLAELLPQPERLGDPIRAELFRNS